MNRVESALPVSQKYGAKVIIYDTLLRHYYLSSNHAYRLRPRLYRRPTS
jgi:hypothetical protein